jgi:hypothetical protein
MKTTVKLAGLILMILLSFSVTLNAQRGMRGMTDSTRMDRMKMGPGLGRMQNRPGPDSVMMKRMHQNMMINMGPGMGVGRMGQRGQFMTPGMGRGMGRGNGPGVRGGMQQMPVNGMGIRPVGPERMIMGSLPNVTEKQKKDMADLKLKQQEEMKKFREETSAKMQSLRDSHNKAMMNLLTEEQKKFIESKQVKPATTPVPAK